MANSGAIMCDPVITFGDGENEASVIVSHYGQRPLDRGQVAWLDHYLSSRKQNPQQRKTAEEERERAKAAMAETIAAMFGRRG